MNKLSFVVVVAVTCANGYVVQRELCVNAASVSEARELFAEYIEQFKRTAHFEVAQVGDVMNTFEQFGKFVNMRSV